MVKVNKQNSVTNDLEGNVIDSQENVEDSEINGKIVELEQKVEEYKSHYLRALADYKNLENRMNAERQKMRIQSKKEVIEKMVEVLDVMEQAESFNADEGLKMVIDTFRKKLAELGVSEINLIGREYDPQYAEVIEVVEGEQDDIIVEVLTKAYEMNGEIIRHGRVKVSKRS